MLERASGCLENAGQRLLWHSEKLVRSRRSLRPRFWHHGEIDIRQWCLVFLESAYQASGARRVHRRTKTTAEDLPRYGYLDFLYPSCRRNLSQNCEPRKHNGGRSRRKLSRTSSRSYTAGLPNHFQGSRDLGSYPEALPSREDSTLHFASERDPVGILDTLLRKPSTPDEDLSSYEEVWTHYQRIQNKEGYLTRVFNYLVTSSRDIDVERSLELFHKIPFKNRSAENYFSVVQLLLRTDHNIDSTMKHVREALLRNQGTICWSYALMHSVHTMRWDLMRDVWRLKPPDVPDIQLQSTLTGLAKFDDLPDRLIELTGSMLSKEMSSDEPAKISKYLLNYIFRSGEIMAEISISQTVNLTQNFHNLGLLEPENYTTAMRALQYRTLPHLPDLAIAMYRNFCWRMTTRPPYEMLTDLLFLVSNPAFEGQSERVRFVVDECMFFYGGMARKHYRFALFYLAKAGEIASVDRLFNRMISEHGLSLGAKGYLPYIYVCAKLGRVDEARSRLDKLPLLGIVPNVYCRNVLLTAYANAGDSHSAFSLFEKMVSERDYTNVTIGILAAMCAKRGDTGTINALINLAVDDAAIPITTSMIDAAVTSCLKNHQPADAERIAENAARNNYAGSKTHMWNMIITYYAFRFELNAAIRVSERMDALRVRRNELTYSALMLALSVVGRTDEALQVARDGEQQHLFHPTELHYSILLRGYVQERNRDMVQVICHEMRDRFDNPSLHSQIGVLEANIQRDLRRHDEQGRSRQDRDLRLVHSERFLANTMGQLQDPASGTGKEKDSWSSLSGSVPAAFYDRLISTYGTKGAFEQIDTLLDKYGVTGTQGISPIRLLSTLMQTHNRREQYDEACACWDMAFSRVTRLVTRPQIESDYLPKPSKSGSASDPVQRAIKSSVFKTTRKSLLVSPGFRFSLSRCISYYIQALAFRGLHSKILDVISDIEARGFALSTQNWSMYVKMMASSPNPADQLRAFTLFEKKFMPNFPGWTGLLERKGKRPEGAPPLDFMEHGHKEQRRARRIWANMRPDFMQPTYITMMYLGSALLDFRERSIMDSGAELKSLFRAAPKTFAALIEMPYINEKFQGVLLRGDTSKKDKKKYFQFNDNYVFTGGVQGDGGSRIDTSGEAFQFEQMWNDAQGEEDAQDEEGDLYGVSESFELSSALSQASQSNLEGRLADGDATWGGSQI